MLNRIQHLATQKENWANVKFWLKSRFNFKRNIMPQKVCFTSRNKVKNTIVKKHQKVKFFNYFKYSLPLYISRTILKSFNRKILQYHSITYKILQYHSITYKILQYHSITYKIKITIITSPCFLYNKANSLTHQYKLFADIKKYIFI